MLARAYGVGSPAAPVRPAAPGVETRAARVSDNASIASIRPADVAARVSAAPGGTGIANLERLVAANVPGRVDFDSPAISLSAPGNYTMHGRPADRNAAAVAVQNGRALDLQA